MLIKILLFIIIVGIILVIWEVSAYNNIVKSSVNVDEAFSTMDVYLKKRYDLIPNLVETVKGYAKHESETLEAVVQARNAAVTATSAGEKMEKDAAVTEALRSIHVVTEQYPDLKANSNFTELMKQLNRAEEDIANARKYYNACVKKYNVRIQTFPGSLLASIFRFDRKPLFGLADAEERENVKVTF